MENKEKIVSENDVLKEEMRESEEIFVEKKGNAMGSLFISLGLSLLSGILGGVVVLVLGTFSSENVSLEEMGQKEQSSLSNGEYLPMLIAEDEAVINVVEKTSAGVVSIVITKDVTQMRRFFNSPFDFFFDGGSGFQQDIQNEPRQQQIGGGTGFFVTSDGMIVTNKHVVKDSNADYTVVTQDGKEYPAQVLALDPVRDLAILKVEGSEFPVLELGEDSSVRAGQTVIAIGYSLGEFTNSISKGIVSGIGRSILAGSGMGQTERLNDIIQTDAAINPGNSGGPLLDIYGRVIGVNVAVAQNAENIGFALPIDPVKKIIEQVQKTGTITVPFLGVRYVILDEEIARVNSLQVDYGALILRGENRMELAVVPGSPADKAGIKENDIILEIEGRRIEKTSPLDALLADFSIGDKITLKVWSAGDTREVQVTLEARK